MSRVLVCGAGGFIGGHLVKALLEQGHTVRAADIKPLRDWWQVHDDAFSLPGCDLRIWEEVSRACEGVDAVYQLAADMGGAGYVFSGGNDANIMHNSAQINLNMAQQASLINVMIGGATLEQRFRLFYSSSACCYPRFNQTDPENPNCEESTAYPADPDSEYGWEKIFSERLYAAYARNYGVEVRIARFHNVYGPHGSWRDGKEKAPAAICRKVLEAVRSGRHEIEIWGTGEQTRSFCWIDDCVRGIQAVMDGDDPRPVNLGSEEMVTINRLVDLAEEVAGVKLERRYKLDAPIGVAGRNSDNTEFRRRYGWDPRTPLRDGLEQTYRWIEKELEKSSPTPQ